MQYIAMVNELFGYAYMAGLGIIGLGILDMVTGRHLYRGLMGILRER